MVATGNSSLEEATMTIGSRVFKVVESVGEISIGDKVLKLES